MRAHDPAARLRLARTRTYLRPHPPGKRQDGDHARTPRISSAGAGQHPRSRLPPPPGHPGNRRARPSSARALPLEKTPFRPESMNVPFANLPLNYQSYRAEYDEAALRVMAHGQFILGPEVAAFEGEWSRFCGAAHAVGVGSGTDALQLILRALGVGPGHEAITV